MKKLLLFSLCLLFAAATAQELTIPVKLLSNAKSGIEHYKGTDAFGYIYTVKDNEFRKEKDGSIQKYKSVSLGEIYSVDLQNPLQIILFYRKFNTVVLLDNQMNEISRINFSDIPQPIIAEAVGLASQNRLWVYDITTQQLGLYGLPQGAFRTITPPFTDTIRFYQNDYNYFYWVDATGHFFMANVFGKVSAMGIMPQYDRLQVISARQVLLSRDNAVFLYDTEAKSLSRIETVEKTFRSFHYAAQILSIFTDTEINQYKIILPQ
ncbi:MAG: hypothetical protein EOO20_26600 [Chryseobacterium sp.]|nr:MAG: hypothetical protein EOO20_26600 [Chryseobacterium sp.]